MRFKQFKFNFRYITAIDIVKNLQPVVCQYQDSPKCLSTYIETRVNQPCCVECLKHHGILKDYPLKKVGQSVLSTTQISLGSENRD